MARTLVLVGKIGPAFRTPEDLIQACTTRPLGRGLVEERYGATYTQAYASYAGRNAQRAGKNRVLSLLISCPDQNGAHALGMLPAAWYEG